MPWIGSGLLEASYGGMPFKYQRETITGDQHRHMNAMHLLPSLLGRFSFLDRIATQKIDHVPYR